MKSSRDPRHLTRISVMKELFAWDFQKKVAPTSKIALLIVKGIRKIDKKITQAAPEWPLEQINKVDLAVLRLAVFELFSFEKKPCINKKNKDIMGKRVPLCGNYKVIVDEAVELAKEFGGESSAAFVNGVLGKIITDFKLDKDYD